MRRITSRGWAALAVLCFSIAAPAAAEWRPSGALTGAVLLRDSNPGPGVLVDLWEPVGILRFGGAIGVGAVNHPEADFTRVLMPVGASLGLRLPMGRVQLALRLRGGIWAGALNEGLSAGGWFSASAGFEYALDDTLGLGVSFDAWYLTGRDSVLLYAPSLGLSWSLDTDSG